MDPFGLPAVDVAVSHTGQWVATILTFALAAAAVIYAVALCVRERIVWPLLLTASGGLGCLCEPLFDHLYGLVFYRTGQWHLYTTFGSAQPIWVPGAYIAFYGGASVVIARTLARKPTGRTVWSMYAAVAAMALIAEITYIHILGVYGYPGEQPFKVLGYPLFLGFTNAMSAVVTGIVAYRLIPHLRGFAQLYLVLLVPSAFTMGLFGGGIVYLSVRHSATPLSPAIQGVAALTVVGAIAVTIGMLAAHLVYGRAPAHPALRATASSSASTPMPSRPDARLSA